LVEPKFWRNIHLALWPTTLGVPAAVGHGVRGNFVAHTLDTKFALFGVRAWEIWCRQGNEKWAANQENLDEAEFRDESGSRKIPYRPTLYPV
jgi:hypothetical protein